VSGARNDRAATQVHDIGIQILRDPDTGETGFRILVGGGLGRTPVIGKTLRGFLPRRYLFSYLEAILRIYNQAGRRDNKYKARIKILVNSLGIAEFSRLVDNEWDAIRKTSKILDVQSLAAMKVQFETSYTEPSPESRTFITEKIRTIPEFRVWYQRNTQAHKAKGYRIVTLSVKAPGKAPGDLTADQMDGVATLASEYSRREIRVSHEQNLVFADVEIAQLHQLWKALLRLELATPNIGTLTDVICCPGLDFCSLANAASIPIAHQISARFSDLDYLHNLGEIKIKISGCMNACGHHHVGHIGILGVDKKGEEWYQITLGGSAEANTSLGKIIGPAVARDRVAVTIEIILQTYLDLRREGEPFLQAVLRLGVKPFKEAVYG